MKEFPRFFSAKADPLGGHATFAALPCCEGSGIRNIAMTNIVANYVHLSLNGLKRRPVLAAMMVYSVGLGAAALMAAFAVWRASPSCPLARRPEQPYVVQIAPQAPAPALTADLRDAS
jgi:hypothetical protein